MSTDKSFATRATTERWGALRTERRSEREIQDAIRIALTRRDDVVLWRNTTGLAVHDGRKQRFGLAVGSADLIGILRLPSGSGLALAIEVKRPDSRLTAEQAMFLALWQKMGGVAIVARSVEEAELGIVEAIESARRSGR